MRAIPDAKLKEDGFRYEAQGEFKKTLKEKVDGKNLEEKKYPKRDSNSENLKASGGSTKKKSNSGDKDKAMQKFMDSIENEVGIPPEKMVAAMALLKPQEMLEPASQTVDAVVENLDLLPNEAAKVRQLYMEMINETQQSELSEKIPDFQINEVGNSESFGFETGSMLDSGVEDLKQEDVLRSAPENRGLSLGHGSENVSLTKDPDSLLSEDSFEKGDGSRLRRDSSEGISSGNLDSSLGFNSNLESNLKSNSILNSKSEFSNSNIFPTNWSDKGVNPPLENGKWKTPSNELLNNSQASQSRLNELELVKSQATEGPNVFNPSIVAPEASEGRLSASQKLDMRLQALINDSSMAGNSQTLQIQPLTAGAGEFGDGASGGSLSSSSKDEIETKDKKGSSDGKTNSIESFFSTMSPLKSSQESSTQAPLIDAAGLGIVSGADSKEPSDMNIRQIMKQADILVKKGGGEVKVQMRPEGMGEVQLRVILNGGKVNLALKAETEEVKKLLEKNLSELRTGLSAHKMAIEAVKIDVAAMGGSFDLSHQNQQNFQQHNPRGNQAEFWNQFHQNFGSSRDQRESLVDQSIAKSYGGNKQVTSSLQPIQENSPRGVYEMGRGKGQGLDLVA